jgi:hypothetical protein
MPDIRFRKHHLRDRHRLSIGMHRARVQTGNPGLDTPGFGRSRARSFLGSVVPGLGIPGFGCSRARSFPVPGIPGIFIHIVAVEIINNEE